MSKSDLQRMNASDQAHTLTWADFAIRTLAACGFFCVPSLTVRSSSLGTAFRVFLLLMLMNSWDPTRCSRRRWSSSDSWLAVTAMMMMLCRGAPALVPFGGVGEAIRLLALLLSLVGPPMPGPRLPVSIVRAWSSLWNWGRLVLAVCALVTVWAGVERVLL
jgi:hypothetical protein